jgi:polysaccharide chain length determinant protein (PEP-CTERM system associated)
MAQSKAYAGRVAIDFEQQPFEGLDWQHYLGLARRHTWHFLVPFLLGWLTVWTASWFMHSVYRSGTLILVEQPTVPQQFVMPNVAGDLQGRLNSITQQILSRTRLLHIIDQFNLYGKDRQRLSPDDLVERMRKDIGIELVRSPDRQELTSFNIYYSAGDPHTAQLVLSELTNLFISENLEVRQQQSENTTRFLESQLEQARTNLAQQEQRVREFKDRYLGQLPGQLQTNLQILSGLQSQLQNEEDALNRAKQQGVYLDSLLNQYHTIQRTAKNGDGTPVGLPALDQELDRLKAQLADLGSRYTDRHPDVRKLKEQIAKTEQLKARVAANLNSKADTASGETGTGDSAKNYTDVANASPMFQIESQAKANQIEIANRQRSIQQLQARIADYQSRLNLEPVREQQLADLSRGYDQSKADYDSLLKKKNESELATSLERQQQGEHFQVLDPPNLPVKPDSPNRLRLLGIGLLVGTMLGVGLAVVMEMTDERIHRSKELKELLPDNVIVEIPPLTTIKEQEQVTRRARLRWAAVTAVFGSVVMAFAATYLRG